MNIVLGLLYILLGCWITGAADGNLRRSGFHHNNSMIYLYGWLIWPFIIPAFLSFIISQRIIEKLQKEDMKVYKNANKYTVKK